MIVRKAKFGYLDYYQLVGKLNYNNNYLDNYLGGIIINLQDSYHDETSCWRPCVVGQKGRSKYQMQRGRGGGAMVMICP